MPPSAAPSYRPFGPDQPAKQSKKKKGEMKGARGKEVEGARGGGEKQTALDSKARKKKKKKKGKKSNGTESGKGKTSR